MGTGAEKAPVIMRTPDAEYLIRQRVAALRRALPAAKDGDAKSLHQARVATRRLRAALPLFGSGRKAEKVARCVRRLTRLLGPARELDVSLLILDELEKSHDVPRAAVDRLRASIADERRRLQEHVRERLDDFDIQKVRKRAIAVARKGVEQKTPRDVEAVAWTHERTTRRARRLAAAIEHAAGLYLPDRLHDVRIAIKKLRYTLELGSVSRDGRTRHAAAIRTLRSMQDLLGRMHDLEVLIARTRSIQSSPGASTLKMSADLDRLVRRLETECRQLHGRYMAARAKLNAACERLLKAGERAERARSSDAA
jgi:CHAD domain-containing protein